MKNELSLQKLGDLSDLVRIGTQWRKDFKKGLLLGRDNTYQKEEDLL